VAPDSGMLVLRLASRREQGESMGRNASASGGDVRVSDLWGRGAWGEGARGVATTKCGVP